MIIATSEGTEVNLRFVVEAIPDGETMLLTLVGGEKRTASFSAWYSAIALATRQIIPAQEGTYALYPCADLGSRGFHQVKVIAWGIDSLRYVRPITVGDAPDGLDGSVPPILQSDGAVDDEGTIYATLAEWLNSIAAEEDPVPGNETSGPRVVH